MSKTEIIRFHITPQTHLRTTQGDKWCFKIPEDCPKKCGLPRKKDKNDIGGCPHMMNQQLYWRKKNIERYNNYKLELLALAKQMHFTVPSFGFALYFFVPIPQYLSKKKRKLLHGHIHDKRVDWDNFAKAWQDAICKEDNRIGQLSGVGKFWVDAEEGWIEVHLDQPIYDPFGVYDVNKFKRKTDTIE